MRRNILALSALLSGAADLVSADCAADNCLRAFRASRIPGRLSTAQSFCATFTHASPAATAIPTFAAQACGEDDNGNLDLRISSACSCIAASTTSGLPTSTGPTTSTSATTTSQAAGACAQVSSSWAAQIQATPTPLVAASLAHDCLNSIPLNKTAALALVDAIVPFLDWQSDVNYKKSPPAGYYYPGSDIYGGMAKVRANLVADAYPNEYAFQQDMYVTVFGPGHDGHFVFYSDALTKVFEWRRKRSLVSVSEDGSSLPVIKLYEDLISSSSTASTIVLINGVPAAKYVQDTIDQAGFNQDVDANYNSMFFEKAAAATNGTGYFSKGGRIRYIYQGANTTFTFANGTILSLENTAAVKANMTDVVDGQSYYNKFCLYRIPTTTAEAVDAPQDAPLIDVTGNSTVTPGYPAPVISTSDGVVSGYYLTGKGFEEVAVLVLLSFEPEDEPSTFQDAIADFIVKAKADGKKKLVIDVQQNGGGYILLGYELFRQLFPHILEDGFSRWRDEASFHGIAHIISDALEGFNPYTSSNSELVDLYESWFNYRYDLNLTDQNFTSFDAKFAPKIYQNTPYTSLMRWNLNDPLTTVNSTYGVGIEISGYGSRQNLTQPFAAEDIILLYDGGCASTCTLASEMLRIQGGVKSVAFGGRPIPGPIQGVGGVKGAQVLAFSSIRGFAQQALQLNTSGSATPEERAAILKLTSTIPEQRSSAASLNVRDQILRGNVEDGIPAQFVTEEADCRLYWTPPMITDVTAVWKAAADSAFNGAKCAYGGIKRRSVQEREANHAERSRMAGQPVSRRQAVVGRSAQRSPEVEQHFKDAHLQKAIP